MLSYAKSRTAGKRLLFLLVLFSLSYFFNTAIAQDDDQPSLRIITLNQDDGLLAIPSQIVLIPGDTLQFIAVNGDFDILIKNAVSFLKIKVADLKIRVDSSSPTTRESAMYIVRNVDGIENEYDIYCISNNNWPLAPPKIIIQSNTNDQ